MDHEQLNTLAATYHGDPNGCMRQVHEMLDAFKRRYLRKANGRYMNDEHSLIETYDNTLWKSLKAYEPTRDFLPFFSSNLKRANVSRIRKSKAEKIAIEAYDLEAMASPDEKVWTRELLVLDWIEDKELNVEECVQKKRDQSHLISNLLATADELTWKICSNYGMYDSENALAKALGIHHTAVSRRLAKLASRYDANRFGNIREYLSA